MPQGTFRFGDWVANPNELSLTSSRGTLRLEPKTMAVLEMLALHAPEVVSIEDMIDKAWSGTVVGDNAVYRAITVLRRALGDSARNPTYIECISRKGYRLKSEVHFERHAHGRVESQEAKGYRLGRLSVAIAFDEDNPEYGRVGTAIARFLGWTTQAFKVQIHPRDVSAADYIVHLHISSGTGEAELSWELMDCCDGALVFASSRGQIVHKEPDLLARIAETIAEGINDQIKRHKSQEIIASGRPAEDLSYWELILTSDQFQGMDPSSLKRREQRLTRAISLFGELAPAHAAYADLLSWRVLNGMAKDGRSVAARARDEVNWAIEFDRDSPYVLSRCGTVLARLGDYPRGVELCERALELAPSVASKEALSRVQCFAGNPEAAIALLNEILDSMPKGLGFRYGKLVVPLVQAGRLEEALDLSYRSTNNYPGDYYAWVLHSNLLMHLQQPDEALEAWRAAKRLASTLALDDVIAGTNRTYGRTEAQVHFLTGGLGELKTRFSAA